MKTISGIFAKVGAGVLIAGLALNFSACTGQSPFEPDDRKDLSATLNNIPDRRADSILFPVADNAVGITKEQGSMTSRYFKKWDAYRGGKIILSQGSRFVLRNDSLTPPAELYGQDVTITMTVVRNEAHNQLIFEFGPHGSTFEPAATVWFHYPGSDPKLYYIEDDGTYTEQNPDEIDTVNGWLKLKIHHFSRYAVAWSN